MIAFHIQRRDHYRILGPVIDLALQRGLDVQIWRPRKEPRKAKAFWREGDATFSRAVRVLRYDSLSSCLTQHDLQAVYSIVPMAASKIGAAKWIGVQFTIDVRTLNAPPFDVIATHSDWWTQWAGKSRCVVVGYPEMDQWHLWPPRAKTTLLYCPYPWLSVPAGAYTQDHERRLITRLRSIADHRGLALVVKARAKDGSPRYVRRVADEVLYDDAYYPATILLAMQSAALCVHHFSGVRLEAAYCGVRDVCLRTDRFTAWPDRAWLDCGALERYTNREEFVRQYIGPADGKASARLLDLAG